MFYSLAIKLVNFSVLKWIAIIHIFIDACFFFMISTIIRYSSYFIWFSFFFFFDYDIAKAVHLTRPNIEFEMRVVLTESHSTIDAPRGQYYRMQDAGCRMLEMTEVKHRRCSNYSTSFVSESKVRLIKCHWLKIRDGEREFRQYLVQRLMTLSN